MTKQVNLASARATLGPVPEAPEGLDDLGSRALAPSLTRPGFGQEALSSGPEDLRRVHAARSHRWKSRRRESRSGQEHRDGGENLQVGAPDLEQQAL